MTKLKKPLKSKTRFSEFSIDEIDEFLTSGDDADELADLEKGLSIDEHGLDESCQMQPELFYQVSKRLALQTSRRDAAKQYLSEVEAIADKEIRERFNEGKDKAKPTEREIEARKIRHPQVKEAQRQLLKLNYSMAQLTALKDSYQQRSYVLKSMIELFLSNYYGEISATGNERDIKERKAHTAKKAMNEMRRGMK